ncbi:MAG: SulP family inorganic anion transporter [Gammaproteobacteria bacterium]|nr:SulP family inorganic anion transporter [Gammaproteobacteria bacterium]
MSYSLKSLRGDLFGGITATVVALPVALAFGVASGLGAAAGLYGAIATGFFAPMFGGTRSQITGPTAPMTVAMAVIVTNYASTLPEAFTVVIMGGLLQVLLGISRIGRFVAYTPHVVVSGFMSGIGIIVMLMQTLPLLGMPAAPGGALGAVRAWPELAANVNMGAFALGAFTLAVGVFWPRRFARRLPAPLVALLAGTLLGLFWLHDAPIIGQVPIGLPQLQFEMPTAAFVASALEPAVILALLGSVDSLLISLVADSLTGTRHNPNRELVGQGVGNVAAGLIGGLPGAGSPLLTMTNIHAGGRTPVASAVFALLVLALLLGLGRFVEPIPHAVLAGILIKIGWDIVDWRLLRRIRRIQPEHLVVMLTTLALTVLVDLITAVAIGLIAAGMAHARQLEGLELDSVVSVPLLDRIFLADREDLAGDDPYSARVGLVKLMGRFTVASAHKLVTAVGADIKDHEVVIFDFSDATSLDDSAAMVVDRLLKIATEERTSYVISTLPDEIREVLDTLGILEKVPPASLAESPDEAREAARSLLARVAPSRSRAEGSLEG